MNDAASQRPAKQPEQTSGVRAGQDSVASSTSSLGGEAVSAPAPKASGGDERNGAAIDAADGGQQDAAAAGKPRPPLDAAKEAPAAECPNLPIELAEVKPQLDFGTEAVRSVGAAPESEAEANPQQGHDSDVEPGTSGHHGYGTFEEPEPSEPKSSTTALHSEIEMVTLLSDITSHNPELSNWMVFTNLMKASMGTGILAMPMAIRNAGYGVGLPLFIAIAAVCVYCIHLLVQSSRTLRRRLKVPTLEYAETAGAACQTSRSPGMRCLAPLVRSFTEVFLAVYMIGTCSVYVLFVKENLKQLIDVACNENDWSALEYLMHLALVLVVLVAIPNLSSLSIVSFIANITMVVGVLMCLGIICHQINVDTQAAQLWYYRTRDTWSNISVYNVTIEPWAGWDRMPLFFGTAVFALEGIGVVLTLENQMKDPTNFLDAFGVLHIAMFTITCLYSLMGLLGYLAYGETTKGSITLNLPPDSTLAFWVRKTVTLAIFLTYPLQFYIPEQILWKWLIVAAVKCVGLAPAQRIADWAQQRDTAKQVPRFLFKILLMLATVCLPLAVPRLGPAISLVGAVCLSMLGLILPTIIHAITHWDEIYQNIRQWKVWSRMVLHVIIVIIGLVGLITGALVSVEELRQEPQEPVTVTVAE